MYERLDLFPVALAGNAKLFYIDEIRKPASRTNNSMIWGGILQKIYDRFMSETRRERMCLFLQTLQIYIFERERSDSSQALEKLIAQIN